MAGLALVIGNGFDIDMGLRSRYSDFAKSSEFKDFANRMLNMFYGEERNLSLVLQLQQASLESTWFDIEEEIHKYIINHPTIDDRKMSMVRSEFEELKKALTKYLKRITTNYTADKERLSTYLFYRLRECPLTVFEIYFNYTNPHEYIKLPLQMEVFNGALHWCSNVHGSLRNDDIVLGCDLQPGEQVNRQLSFMYKYNMLHQANHVARNLLEAKEIVFFGHSVNEMDFCYFREFFKAVCASPDPIRHLTIITYDEQSERNIKDNIRNQGISVTDLYNNLWTFEFIHTQKIYTGDEKEQKKWSELIERLLAKDRHGI